ncbi:MAG: 3-phosphoshikimate 1-carboxyvinyltransferase [Candidatus Eremiobacteraeota bacterium]|nr:3-phosphoshikimate 1-carboxyvinyltransferase [Candidatus Eremiobacteraeota bacterium]
MAKSALATPQVFHAGHLRGTIAVPGDKSISHRALILGAASPEPLEITHVNPGRDVRATMEALIALGARIERDGSSLRIAAARLRESMGTLECMNSASTARMLLGVCAGADIRAQFDGDGSLRKRPMEPVAAQLRAFGAKIETENGRMPMRIEGTPQVETRDFILLDASAQVKSALLFASVYSGAPISISADRGSRDHTERLLHYLGADIAWNGRNIALRSSALLQRPIAVAGDFSAAAFFIVAATIADGSDLSIPDVNVNPTRTGLLDILQTMGARIEISNRRDAANEPVADLRVFSAPLQAVTVGADLALRAIDEIPLVAIAGAFAAGETKISGIQALRSKESDRVAGIERLLRAAGIESETASSGLVIQGGTPKGTGTMVETHGDHRIAMAAATLAAAAGPIAVDSDADFDVSFPSFAQTLRSVQHA